MKALIIAISFLFTAPAFAAIDFSKAQGIDKVEANGEASKYTGTVQIINDNLKRNPSIVLKLAAPFYCPPGRVCAQVMDAFTMSAEIVSQTESCGSIIYTAITDGTPHDGLKEEITLQDNSSRLCRDIRPGLIEITAKSTAVRTQTVKTYFAVQTYKNRIGNFDLSKGVKLKSVKLSGAEGAGRAGFVKVDSTSGEVLISYMYAECNGQGVCQKMYKHKQIKLALVSQKADACGSIVYQAQDSVVDTRGVSHSVTITDHSQRLLCEDVIPALFVVEGTICDTFPHRQRTSFKMM